MSEIIHSRSAHQTMWRSLADKAYRHAFAVAHVGDFLAMQIYSMRIARGWTQKRLAEDSGIPQPQISKHETSCEGVNLSSLHKLAAAFDVALIVKFVPFSQLAREAIDGRAEQTVPAFEDDSMLAIGFNESRIVPLEPRQASGRRIGDNNQSYFRKLPETSTAPLTASVS